MTDAPNRPTCPWHPDLMMLSHSEWSNEGTGVVHMVCPRGCRGPGAPSPEAALAAAARTEPGEFPAPVALAAQFHEVYERLAPSFDYETRPDTRVFEAHSRNGRLMTAVCREILDWLARVNAPARPAATIDLSDEEREACIELGRKCWKAAHDEEGQLDFALSCAVSHAERILRERASGEERA